jgi:very-short-patch-repair endonuclease
MPENSTSPKITIKCFRCNTNPIRYRSRRTLLCAECLKRFQSGNRGENIWKKSDTKKRLAEFREENANHITPSQKKADKIIRKIVKKFGLQYTTEAPLIPYIIDFYFKEVKIAIEIDGGIHDRQIAYDDRRDEFLKKIYGITVIRLKNEEVETVFFKQVIVSIGYDYIKHKILSMNNLFISQGITIPHEFSHITGEPIQFKKLYLGK